MNRVLAGSLLVIVACSAPRGAAPPQISFGRDTCRECGMVISDARFAAAYWVEDEPWVFDDIAEMVRYGVRTGTLTTETPAWVHDFERLEWIDAGAAWYARPPTGTSPMGIGIAAFSTEAAAVVHAGFGGTVLRWDNLLMFAADGLGPFSDHEH